MAKREETDDHGYPLAPRDVNQLAWFYVQREGLVVAVQAKANVDAGTVTIPWSKVGAAVDLHRKNAAARKRRKSQ